MRRPPYAASMAGTRRAKKMITPEDNANRLCVTIEVKSNKCICGSGNAPERCCGTPKLLSRTLSMHTANFYTSDGLAISDNGEVLRRVGSRLLPLKGKATLKASTPKLSGQQKLTTAGSFHSGANLNPDAIVHPYQHALVVDTNTLTSKECTYSATGIFRVTIERVSRNEAIIGYEPALLIGFKNPKFNPERIGWLMAIDAIKHSQNLSGRRVALITDHDVSAHKTLNLRHQPIIGRHKIPKNIHLIYSAADRGDGFLNKLMRKADLLACHGLKTINVANSEFSEWMPGEQYFCDQFRVSRPDPSLDKWKIQI